MEQQQLKRCSIGVQTFEKVIEGNYLYIDKTEYIYRMATRCFQLLFPEPFLPVRQVIADFHVGYSKQ